MPVPGTSEPALPTVPLGPMLHARPELVPELTSGVKVPRAQPRRRKAAGAAASQAAWSRA